MPTSVWYGPPWYPDCSDSKKKSDELVSLDLSETKKVLQIGDRVYYVSDVHGQSLPNPLKGSRYECVGTIVPSKNLCSYPARVRWDNGSENSYNFNDLELESRPNPDPNAVFRLRKGKGR